MIKQTTDILAELVSKDVARAIEEIRAEHVIWPFPNKPPKHEPLDRLPFNPENEEDAPL